MLDIINGIIKRLHLDGIEPITDDDLKWLLMIASDMRPPCLPKDDQDMAVAFYIIALLLSKRGGVDLTAIASMSIGEQSMTFSRDGGLYGVNSPKYWFDKWRRMMARCGARVAITRTQGNCGCR